MKIFVSNRCYYDVCSALNLKIPAKIFITYPGINNQFSSVCLTTTVLYVELILKYDNSLLPPCLILQRVGRFQQVIKLYFDNETWRKNDCYLHIFCKGVDNENTFKSELLLTLLMEIFQI